MAGLLNKLCRRNPWTPGRRADVAAATHEGRSHSRNQDSFLTLKLPLADDALLGVADGIGGCDVGEVASYFALKFVAQERLRASAAEGIRDPRAARQILTAGLHKANFLLSRVNQGLGAGTFVMGTTVAVLMFVARRAVIAHAGDSRCYRLRRGTLRQLTRDDTWAQSLVEKGQIGPEQVAGHPWEHTLSKCIGVTPELEVCVQEHACRRNDRYLLCTDGVFKQLTDSHLARCLAEATSAEEAVHTVIRDSLRAGSTDNITVGVACLP